MADEARDEEASWRDLVAHYSTPAAADGATPWPVREELSSARQAPSMDTTDGRGASGAPGPVSTGDPGPHADQTGRRADQAGPGADQAGPGADQEDPGASQPGWDPVPGVIPAQPQTRIVRPAVPAPLPLAGDDEHYVPPAPPPLPRLDPVSKGAWAALFGGPGYLLLAVLLGWVVPSWAAFCAVGAFVGGLATLVVRMGDRPPDDSGSDDGAVV